MLNIRARFILVSSSLSPALGAIAVSQIVCDERWTTWIWWPIGALVLILMCWRVLEYAKRKAPEHPLYIKEFERRDHEVLTFLFVCLLPFIRTTNLDFADDWIIIAYVISIIVVALIHANAFHFNPVMSLIFGYRFYSVKSQQGISSLLISKKELRRPEVQVATVLIGTNIYLYTGDCDV